MFLARNPWCSLPGGGCTRLATLVDHRIPHRGDMTLFWNHDNWQGLCEHCHNVHKQRMENQAPMRDHRGRLLPLQGGADLHYTGVPDKRDR